MDSYIKKLKAKLPSITCKNDLQKALGLLNVLRPFIPGLAQRLHPFYHWTRQTVKKKD